MDNFKGGALERPDDRRNVRIEELAIAGEMPQQFFSPWVVAACKEYGINQQGQQFSCTAESSDKIQGALQAVGGLGTRKYSARFLYALSKRDDGMPTIPGTYLDMPARIMQKYGSAEERYFRSDHELARTEFESSMAIPSEAYRNAERFKIERYAFTDRAMASYKLAIWTTKGNAIIGGYSVGNDYVSQPMVPPTNDSEVKFGHANCFFGWDQNYVYAVGSWGENYGATLYMKRVNLPVFGEIWMKGSPTDYEVRIRGIHIFARDYFESGYMFRGVAHFDETFPPEQEAKIKFMKLLRQKYTENVYFIMNNKRYLIVNEAMFNDGRSEGAWGDWDFVQDVQEAELLKYPLAKVGFNELYKLITSK